MADEVEVEKPEKDFRLVLKDEADKVPERARGYYDDISQTIDPVLKTVAVVAAGVAAIIGFVFIIGEGKK